MEDIADAANLQQKLQAVGLRAYPLHDWIGSVEPMVKLLA
jgi:hypothetical protein